MKLSSETLKKAAALRRGNPKQKEEKGPPAVTWETLSQAHSPEAVEAFLTAADVANVMDTLEIQVLKKGLIHCTVTHFRSWPIQARAYQLLQDLVLNSPESLFSDYELDKCICNALESLQTWISREAVLQAVFDFLSTIYFRLIKHDYPEYNMRLITLGTSAITRNPDSKTVPQAVVTFFGHLYRRASRIAILTTYSHEAFEAIINVLRRGNQEKSVVFQCFSALDSAATACPGALDELIEDVIDACFRELVHHHSNNDICSMIFILLNHIVIERKHYEHFGTITDCIMTICEVIPRMQSSGYEESVDAVVEMLLRGLRTGNEEVLNSLPYYYHMSLALVRNCLQHSEYCRTPGDDCGCFSSRRADMCAEIIDITTSLQCENGDHAVETAAPENHGDDVFQVGSLSSESHMEEKEEASEESSVGDEFEEVSRASSKNESLQEHHNGNGEEASGGHDGMSDSEESICDIEDIEQSHGADAAADISGAYYTPQTRLRDVTADDALDSPVIEQHSPVASPALSHRSTDRKFEISSPSQQTNSVRETQETFQKMMEYETQIEDLKSQLDDFRDMYNMAVASQRTLQEHCCRVEDDKRKLKKQCDELAIKLQTLTMERLQERQYQESQQSASLVANEGVETVAPLSPNDKLETGRNESSNIDESVSPDEQGVLRVEELYDDKQCVHNIATSPPTKILPVNASEKYSSLIPGDLFVASEEMRVEYARGLRIGLKMHRHENAGTVEFRYFNVLADIDIELFKESVALVEVMFLYHRYIYISNNNDRMTADALLPRSTLRRTLLSAELQILETKRFLSSDVDIVLHMLPTKMSGMQVASAIMLCFCRKYKKFPLNNILRRMNQHIVMYMDLQLSLKITDNKEQSLNEEMSSDEMEEAKHLLYSERKTLQHIYDYYLQAQAGLTFEQVYIFLKDFELLSDLLDTNAYLSLYHRVLSPKKCEKLTSKDFMTLLLQIALVWDGLGVRSQELSPKQRLSNLFWWMQSCGGFERMVVKDRVRTVVPHFKMKRDVMLVKQNPIEMLLKRNESVTPSKTSRRKV